MLPGGVSVVGLCLKSPVIEQDVLIRLKKLTTKLCKPRQFLCLSHPPKLLMIHFSTVTARSVPFLNHILYNDVYALSIALHVIVSLHHTIQW